MYTRSKSTTLVPKHHFNLSATTLVSSTPSTYHGALKDPNWFNAMREEYNALVDQNTWTLVPRLVGANVVTGKWIYRHKYQPDGSLSRYKARWVVCGFSQPHGVDYEETLSPIIKPATILVVLHDQLFWWFATTNKWPIHQLDAKNAFLHGSLQEIVYAQ
jgi:hypothetical protein